MRGNRNHRRRRRRQPGSIPACAGEPAVNSQLASAALGLSPRVRGNRRPCGRRLPDAGSIPACAGEPSSTPPSPATPAVYPRVCGGTGALDVRPVLLRGLSPRVRGNPANLAEMRRCRRSIPACAGEPHHCRAPRQCPWVYPRVCGGTEGGCAWRRGWRGLSPRVRGNLNHPAAVVPQPRSIPACAGEPMPSPTRQGCTPVYPRVCGGTRSTISCANGDRGLSPRVRGNPAHRAARLPVLRSIPACAGEPSFP